jgi:hypothetical protein
MDIFIPTPSSHFRDFGPLLPIHCPQCDTDQVYRLFTCRDELPLNTFRSWFLYCPQCEREEYLSKGDCEHVSELCALAEAAAAGKIEGDGLSEEVKALDLDVVNGLLALTEDWSCPSCGEEVPVSFAVCWKCGTEAPESQTIVSVSDSSLGQVTGDPVMGWQGGSLVSHDTRPDGDADDSPESTDQE